MYFSFAFARRSRSEKILGGRKNPNEEIVVGVFRKKSPLIFGTHFNMALRKNASTDMTKLNISPQWNKILEKADDNRFIFESAIEQKKDQIFRYRYRREKRTKLSKNQELRKSENKFVVRFLGSSKRQIWHVIHFWNEEIVLFLMKYNFRSKKELFVITYNSHVYSGDTYGLKSVALRWSTVSVMSKRISIFSLTRLLRTKDVHLFLHQEFSFSFELDISSISSKRIIFKEKVS